MSLLCQSDHLPAGRKRMTLQPRSHPHPPGPVSLVSLWPHLRFLLHSLCRFSILAHLALPGEGSLGSGSSCPAASARLRRHRVPALNSACIAKTKQQDGNLSYLLLVAQLCNRSWKQVTHLTVGTLRGVIQGVLEMEQSCQEFSFPHLIRCQPLVGCTQFQAQISQGL